MARFGMKEVFNVSFLDVNTKEEVLYLDTLKMSNLENNAEQVYAQGGQGNGRLIGWDYNHTVTFSLQDALLNPKSLSMQTGNEAVSGAAQVYKREVLTAIASSTAGKTEVTLANTPTANTVKVVKTTDGYERGDTVAYTLVGSDMEFDNTEIAVGEKVIVTYFYQSGTNATLFTISGNKYPSTYMVIGDTLVRNEATGVDEALQLVIPKAKLLPTFALNLSADGQPVVFDMNIEVLKTADNTMVQMIKY